MATPSFGSVPFAEQEAFFRRKLNLPTQGWTDVYGEENDWGFVVAGANRDEILQDFRVAVERFIKEGRTLEDFRRDFDTIVAKYGWDYNGGRDWRSRVIYETNLRSSYAAGRWEQLQAVKASRPYWRYVHSDAVRHPRPIHQSWDGMVLHADDPWWRTHYPPNGWGCQCSVQALNERDLKRLGKRGPDKAPSIDYETRTIGQRSANGPRDVRVPVGIDPGFEYAPGRARLHSATPPVSPGPLAPGVPSRPPTDPALPPRPVSASRRMPEATTAEEAVERVLSELDAERAPRILQDAIGERLVIGPELFRDAQGALALPVSPSDAPLLVDALLAPDEIWTRIEWVSSGIAAVRRRYLARVRVAGDYRSLLVVFEHGRDGWNATVLDDDAIDAWRVGVRLYRREDD